MQDLLFGLVRMDVFAYSWIILLLAALALILLLEYFNISRYHVWIGIGALALSSIPLIWYLVTPPANPFFFGPGNTYRSALLVIDHFSAFLGLIFISVNIFVLIASLEFMKKESDLYVFTSLLIIVTMGMILVAATLDVAVLVVSWELVSIPSYILVSFKKNERESTEAAVKFIIVGAVSSAIMLFGASLLYGITPNGLTNYYIIMEAAANTSKEYAAFVIIGVTLVVAGLGFKMGTVPFQWWLPDAYEGALTPVTTMLAAASKKVGFAAGFRVLIVPLMLSLPPISTPSKWVTPQALEVILSILALVAIGTMVIGNIGALVQTKMKRLLAYSSIGQAGYLMLSIAAFNELSYIGGLYHVFAHAFMTVGAFIAVMIVTSRTGTDDITDYKGLARRMPGTTTALIISLLSLAGIPPLIGFASKFMIFLGALRGGILSGILFSAALIMALTSAISVYYYLRVVKYMLIDLPPENLPDETFHKAARVPVAYAFPLLITTIIVALFGLFSGDLLTFLDIVQRATWNYLDYIAMFL